MSNFAYVTLTDDNFQQEVLESKEPVLVDFWASWCGPCRIVHPIVEQLALDFAGRVKVGKLNVDDQPKAASRYGISAIPTLLIFHNGQVVDQVIGIVPKLDIATKLNAVLDRSMTSIA